MRKIRSELLDSLKSIMPQITRSHMLFESISLYRELEEAKENIFRSDIVDGVRIFEQLKNDIDGTLL